MRGRFAGSIAGVGRWRLNCPFAPGADPRSGPSSISTTSREIRCVRCARSPPSPPTSSAPGTSSTPRARCWAGSPPRPPRCCGQAQADLGAPRRHRRPRDRGQRGQARHEPAQARRQAVPPPLRLPGRAHHRVARAPARARPRAGRAPRGQRHAPEEPPRPQADQEAAGLRRPRAPARRAAARTVRHRVEASSRR